MKTIRKTIYQRSFPGLTVKVQCVFDFKHGLRFSTILPTEGFCDRSPFKVIFRVLKIQKRFWNARKSLDRTTKRLVKAYSAFAKQADNCAKNLSKMAVALKKENYNEQE